LKAAARGGAGEGLGASRLAARFGEPSSRRGWEEKRKGRSGLGRRRETEEELRKRAREESGRERGRLEADRVRGVWWAVRL
jgi:hypothetical protein